MKNKNIFGAISLVIIGIVFGAVLVSGFGWVRPSLADVQVGSSQAPVQSLNKEALSFNDAFVNVAETVTPSIVQIRVITTVKNKMMDQFQFFFPFREDVPREQQSGGSGVIISDDGYILTNNHVVDNATQVTVTLNDKKEFDATVIGNDPLTDLAVIKISETNLTEAYLGNSDDLKVGQWVMAIGNPLSLTSTVTAGIVSATGRSLNLIQDSYGVENYIQTDAAINPGNSGGALVDLKGAVIGINSAIATNGMTQSYIGYGFAIPINLAKAVAEDLIANGKVSRGYIGVNITEVDAATAKAIGLDKPRGVMIQGVVEGGAADGEDIEPGDVILKIDEKILNQPNELQSYVASKRAGTSIKLTLYRDGKEIERYITLKARDKDGNIESVEEDSKRESKSEDEMMEVTFDDIGLTIKNLSERDYDAYDVESGVMIKSVKRYSKAFNQGLFAGLIITHVDKEKISNVSEFEDIIKNKKGEAVLIKIVDRNKTARFLGIEIPE